MNECFLLGKIISEIEFEFAIYGKHDSITRFKLKLENGSIVNVKAYDELADYCYRKLNKNNKIFIYGKLNTNLEIFMTTVYCIK